MRWFCMGLLISLASCSTSSKGLPAAGATGVPAEPLLTYCDLVSAPEKYYGREVRVVGVYRFGFEVEELYSTRCPDAGNTWVEEWSGYWCFDRPGQKDLTLPWEGTFGLIARGTLTGGGKGYGHLNGYTFQFDVSCIEHIELLDHIFYHQRALTPDVHRKVERFEARRAPGNGT
ncbi:MAG TPA: hypothetical protein VHQ90_05275 [Thermoanaerobaculia bacterium]|nr:hypothetical protein [Thermoanaerobaculia bacterium]